MWVHITPKGEIWEYPVGSFPMEVFMINQHVPAKFYTTEKSNSNTFYFSLNKKNYTKVAASLRSLMTCGEYHVSDHFSWSNYLGLKENYLYTTGTIFYTWASDIRVACLTNSKNNIFTSGSKVYQNLTWLERESSEMFDLIYVGLRDTRKLLLDYTTQRGVMDKIYNKTQYSSYFINLRGVNFDNY
jgi:NADH:ubiquinone oxidoreductase subunit C